MTWKPEDLNIVLFLFVINHVILGGKTHNFHRPWVKKFCECFMNFFQVDIQDLLGTLLAVGIIYLISYACG